MVSATSKDFSGFVVVAAEAVAGASREELATRHSAEAFRATSFAAALPRSRSRINEAIWLLQPR